MRQVFAPTLLGENVESGRGSGTAKPGEAEASLPPRPPPVPSRRCRGCRGCRGCMSPVTCAESVPWRVARWLHGGTILRSRELGMMDLELTRWKRVGLFYKQLKSSPQTVFRSAVFSVELLASWASRLHWRGKRKGSGPSRGPPVTTYGDRAVARLHPI